LNCVDCILDSDLSGCWAVLGANGAGKSTMLEAVPGLLLPSRGRVLVDAIPVETKNLPRVRRKVGMIFQNSDDQLFSQTVAEDVAFGPGNLGMSAEALQQAVDQALTVMEIRHLSGRSVTGLSGGEKRRVALAGVLAMNPEAILLDEPTSMLDPRGARELAEYLKKLPALIVVATHDLEFARRIARRAVVLQEGRIIRCDDMARILNDRDFLLSCDLA
ncbi:MAG: ABC transporter ATP-binding protein, partial [Victivallaceae bacterium]|nr:ABC transporter ATP-binding protein [Victivallaceae bacterium]